MTALVWFRRDFRLTDNPALTAAVQRRERVVPVVIHAPEEQVPWVALPQNTLGWQWSAGCGTDAAPYFRIFNSVLQGEKFDGTGEYTRQWVPEVAKLGETFLHRPWEAPGELRRAASIGLDSPYARPIVTSRRIARPGIGRLRAHQGPSMRRWLSAPLPQRWNRVHEHLRRARA